FEKTGEIKWATDLARIPEQYGVTNVYAEMGTSFANSCTANPRFAAALVGTWIKGLGVVWLTTVANRSSTPSGNSRRHAEKVWLCATWSGQWLGEESDLWIQFSPLI